MQCAKTVLRAQFRTDGVRFMIAHKGTLATIESGIMITSYDTGFDPLVAIMNLTPSTYTAFFFGLRSIAHTTRPGR